MYLDRIDESLRPELAALAEALRSEMAPLVLGQERPPWQCCGASRHGAARAVKISMPSESGHISQTTGYATWTVKMEPVGGDMSQRGYSLSLTQFVPAEQLEALFNQHFRQFTEAHFRWPLAEVEARHAPGGDLHGGCFGVWF